MTAKEFYKRLESPEIQMYIVVVMALNDFKRGDYATGMERLVVDCDKLRMHDPELVEEIRQRYNTFKRDKCYE